jgi:hypothetical protein
VRVTLQFGAAELGAIEQAGVVELVLHAHVAARQQRLQRAEIGHVAGGEQQRALAPGPGGQRFFQFRVRGAVAADQVRRRAAHAFLARRPGERGDQLRVLRQAEVVVAAERQQALAAGFQPRAVGVVDRAQPAQQPGAGTFSRLDGHAFEQVRPRHCSHSLVRSR